MATAKTVIALVLAGGKGERLRPLTNEHAKPALPFAGGHRIVDFVLSNLFNSQISRIYVLAQYKPYSLIQHLDMRWGLTAFDGERSLEVLLPRRSRDTGGFRGTADAVYQNLDLIDRHKPDLVAVFAADHVYRMDIRQMVDFHELRDADVTVAAVPVPVERASSFGIIGADLQGRVQDFQEKPLRPRPMPLRHGYAYASMGNYLFRPEVLIEGLCQANAAGEHDFGRHLLPRFAQSHRTYAYDFATNRVPGVAPDEELAYWRDVGTVEAYRAAQSDAVGPKPRFQLWNPEWPIWGQSADEAAACALETQAARTLQLPRPTAAHPRVTDREHVRRDGLVAT